MRSFVVMAMFTASLAHAGWNDYEEVRELNVDAAGASEFVIDAGAGSMVVTGDGNASEIEVTATIQVDTGDDKKAQEIIADRLTLTLDRNGDSVILKSYFDGGMWGNSSGSVKLEVVMPQGISLQVDDGSGSIVIEDTEGDVEVEDGSGSLKVFNAGNVEIDDGSGSIEVEGATGDISIIDGSGSITVSEVGGSVTIDDGSGSINIDDVAKDVIIEDDGSGGLNVSNVRGKVESDT
ncbi:MAG: DUF4097 domain-containing protein [Alphaproteobacteria bacterium]|nr:DUF4097 domain-containing protein [Alphaproteobacteria bacterium]